MDRVKAPAKSVEGSGKGHFLQPKWGDGPWGAGSLRDRFEVVRPLIRGGSLLDIGIYNVFITLSVLGRPDIIEACMTPASTGVDEQCAATFRYNNGAIAQLFSSFSSNLATEADISGTKGRIRLTPRFYNPTTAVIEYYPGRIDTKQIIPHHSEPGFGYQYQARHVCECLRQGLTESPVMSHADTLLIMETMDRIRASAGIYYEVD